MTRRLPCSLLLFTFLLPMGVSAQEIPIGTVERIQADSVTVTPVPSRPLMAPGERVAFRSRIPGIDEAVESGKGQIDGTSDGRIRIQVEEGDVAIGDEAVLLRGQFVSGAPSIDEVSWLRMDVSDLEAPIYAEHPGALCALAGFYELGFGGKEKSLPTYLRLARKAMNLGPSTTCAAHFASQIYYGDQLNEPPLFRADRREGEIWALYAAEKGDLNGMLLYARILISLDRVDEAEEWINRVLNSGNERMANHARKEFRHFLDIRRSRR